MALEDGCVSSQPLSLPGEVAATLAHLLAHWLRALGTERAKDLAASGVIGSRQNKGTQPGGWMLARDQAAGGRGGLSPSGRVGG